MPNRKSTVLITGANGFVGSRLCRHLLDEQFNVVAGVRRGADLSSLRALGLSMRYGDVTQPDTLPAMVAGIDYVVHNAGVVKARQREAFTQVNEEGTRHLMEALLAHNAGVRRVLYVSSLAAAGPQTDTQPIAESAPPCPVTAYGRSKLAGERIALGYADRLDVISLRPSGVYGPGDREILGFFETVHRGIRPRIGNMDRKLQLVHVDDLARAVSLALTGGARSGEVYHVAEKRAYTMNELVALLAAAVGRRGIPLPLPGLAFSAVAALSEVAFRLVGATPMLTREKARELLGSWEVSVDKARRDFGFESRIVFEQGARETYQWYLREGWLR